MPKKNIAMTVREAANELGVSVQYIYQLMRARPGEEPKLEQWEPPVQGDRTIYVTIASVERFQRERTSESSAGGTQMNKITCERCNHENDPGARVCVKCYARLSDVARAKATVGLRARLASIPVGKFVPVGLILIFLILLAALSPDKQTFHNLFIQFGLLGLVALGVTFPLTKGHYDLSCGPVAGLAACATILATHSEPILTLPVGVTAALVGILVGLAAGLINGIVVGWSRLPSAVFTIIMAVAATELAHTIALRNELVVADPAFKAIGEAEFLGIPAALLLLAAAALVTVLLWGRETFWPLSRASSRKWTIRLTTPPKIMWSFAMSGLLGGLAGVFIAGCGLPVTSPMGQATWILAPLTAAILGGGVVIVGMGGTGTALLGAAALTLIGSFLHKLHIPIAGPVAEGFILFAMLASGRILSLTWYEIQELRRGNLLGIPGAQRLPQLLFHSRYSRAIWAATTILVATAAYGYVAYFSALYVPDDAAAIVSYTGNVQVLESRPDREPIARSIKVGLLLKRGDIVRTGAESECLLRMSDETQVQLSANTSLQITQIAQEADGTRDVRMRVGIGRLWANVAKLLTRESSFQVETPLLTVAVRGTLFEVEVSEKTAKVGVLDGALSLFRLFTGIDQYGDPFERREYGKLLGGEGLITYEDLPMGTPHALPEFQRQRMQRIATSAAAEVGHAFLGPKFLKAIGGLVLLCISIYLIILYAGAGAARVVMPEDVEEATRRLEATRTRTADDSPRSVAVAQMHLQVGNKEAARDELEKIVAADPESEYGQWAQRMLGTLTGETGPEGEDSDET